VTRGNGLVVAPRQGQVLPPGLDHDFAAAIDRFNCVANQVANRASQLRLRAAHGKRLSEAVDHHVDVAALVASKTRTVFRQAGPYYAVEIDVLFHGPALAAEREEIFDGLGGTQGRVLMSSTSARMSPAARSSVFSLSRPSRMRSGSATSGPRTLLRSCATPPARTLNASIRFVVAKRSCTLRSCSMVFCTSSCGRRMFFKTAVISLRKTA